jgi:hypothetical protein
MAKVEASLPLLAKEGWKNKKIMGLLNKPTIVGQKGLEK